MLKAEILLGWTGCKVHRPQVDPYSWVVSERPEIKLTDSGYMKKDKIKNRMEAQCNEQCRKYQTYLANKENKFIDLCAGLGKVVENQLLTM